MLAALDIILKLAALLGGALNVLDRTGVVSRIIGEHIAAGTTEWTDAQRNEIRKAAIDAKAQADADITAAGG